MSDSTTPGSSQDNGLKQILAIDLGKFKSVACDYDAQTGEHRFDTIPTRPQDFHDLLTERQPDRLVIEIGSAAGWVADMAQALSIEVQIANPNHEAWRWKNVKRKTDKDDALKLAQQQGHRIKSSSSDFLT